MAQPARKPDEEWGEQHADPHAWNPRVIQGGGEGDGKPQGKLSSADDSDQDSDEGDGDEASEDLRQLEDNPSGPASGDSPDVQEQQPWQTDVSQKSPAEKTVGNLSNLKKGGLIGTALVTVIFGGMALFYGLINSFVINFKENYYNWSMKRGYTRTAQRAARNFEKRVFSDPAECEGIRCRYRSGVSRDQIDDLKRKGAVVDFTGPNDRGRYTISKITVNGIELNRNNYLEQFKTNKLVRGFHAKATDVSGTFPRTTTMVTKLFRKLGVSRQNPLQDAEDNSRQGFKKAFRNYVFGSEPGANTRFKRIVDRLLPASARAEGGEQREDLLDDPTAEREDAPDVDSAADTALRAAKYGRVTAFLDGSCTIRNLVRGLVFAVKFYRMISLIKYASFFMVFADAIKAGEVTPAQLNFVALMLLTPDEKGRTFFDSPGFQHLLYKVKPGSAAIAPYSVGRPTGGFLGKAYGATKKFEKGAKSVGFNVNGTCSAVTSPIGQGTLFLIDAITSIGSLGLKKIFLSATVGFGFSYLIGALTEYAMPHIVQAYAGTVGTGDETGYEIGTMVAAGMSAMSTQLSRAQGLRPMTDEEVASYDQEVNSLYNDFFAHQKPSLTDKISANMTGFGMYAITSLNSSLFMPQQLFGFASSNYSSSKVFAVDEVGNSEVCADPALEPFATTPYCTLIYSESTELLVDDPAYDPEEVLRFMLADDNLYDDNPGNVEEAYVTAEGEPAPTENGQEYKDYRDTCMDGAAPLLDTPVEGMPTGDEDTLLAYCSSTEEKYTYFRMYRLDSNITEPPEALNDEFYSQGGVGSPGAPPSTCQGATMIADFESGNLEDYGDPQALGPGGITLVTDQVRAGTYALKNTIDGSTRVTGDTLRSHFHMEDFAQSQGAVKTFCHSVMIPPGNGSMDHFWVLLEWFGPPWNGSPPMSLDATNEVLEFNVHPNGSNKQVFGSLPRKDGVWYDFVWQIKFSRGGDGYIKVSGGEAGQPSQLIGEWNGPTMHSDHSQVYPMLNSYSSSNSGRPLNVYHDEVKLSQ